MPRRLAPSQLSGVQIVFLLAGFATLGHLNRVGIAVAGSEARGRWLG